MFDWRLKWQVRQARKNLEAVERRLDKAMDEAADEEKRHRTWSEWQTFEIDPLEGEYRQLLTHYWTKMARDKFIPIPERNEDEQYWEQTMSLNRWVLTDRGISQLRSAVRQETSSSNDSFFRWGAVILGLMAVAAQFLP